MRLCIQTREMYGISEQRIINAMLIFQQMHMTKQDELRGKIMVLILPDKDDTRIFKKCDMIGHDMINTKGM